MWGQVTETTVVGNSVITYTDYDNVQLRVLCSNVNNFWFGTKFFYYFILVRDRKFDSVTKLAPAIQNLISMGITNFDNLVFLKNSPNCKN